MNAHPAHAPDLPLPGKGPGREPRVLRAGFIPLVDASILLAAAEAGFAEREGLRLELVRDVSWANVRDRLAFRQFDIAHMLSPMPVAAQLGLGSNPSPAVTPFFLGQGGNAITLALRLFEEMAELAEGVERADALGCARALALVVRARREGGMAPLTLGVTYPFSSHNYEFRYWLAAGGIDPDADVRLVVVPPPMTSDALEAGAIDGFCVGAPWNMIACERGVGRIVAVKQDIWPLAPEKVLAMRPEWADANQDTVMRLIVALDRAARWCQAPENHDDLAAILADPRYLGAPKDILRRVLAGEFSLDAHGRTRRIDSYFRFHGQSSNVPSRTLALWIYSQMIRWGQAEFSQTLAEKAAGSCRPDLYRMALGAEADADLEDAALAAAAFMDGAHFDPQDIMAHVEGFPVRRRPGEPVPLSEV
ncbi:CmpA/NrtA family ABC transporter substrate-binding protein [Pannonibacter sp. Q-1]